MISDDFLNICWADPGSIQESLWDPRDVTRGRVRGGPGVVTDVTSSHFQKWFLAKDSGRSPLKGTPRFIRGITKECSPDLAVIDIRSSIIQQVRPLLVTEMGLRFLCFVHRTHVRFLFLTHPRQMNWGIWERPKQNRRSTRFLNTL